MKLNTAYLQVLFLGCLFEEQEIVDGKQPEGAVVVEGVTTKFGFHPVRLFQARQQVVDWLAELPIGFREDGGGGWSFLNGCHKESGEQWGEHRNLEQLIALGIGLGLVEFQMPRDMWNTLPGGVPYFVILNNPSKEWVERMLSDGKKS